MSLDKLLLLIFPLIFFTCWTKQEKCEFESIERMDTILGVNGTDTSYYHRVLIKDFSESCFDSATCIRLFKGYLDTVTVNKPVDGIFFHNSGEWFYNPSPWVKDAIDDPDEIDDILALVYLGKDNQYEFVFYDDEGNMIDNGSKWKN